MCSLDDLTREALRLQREFMRLANEFQQACGDSELLARLEVRNESLLAQVRNLERRSEVYRLPATRPPGATLQ